MLPSFHLIHVFYLSLAIFFEVLANVLMKFSNGFQYKICGFSALACALLGFTALSYAIAGIQLSVAYGIWGGVGVIATSCIGIYFFKEKLLSRGWLGVVFVLIGIFLLKNA